MNINISINRELPKPKVFVHIGNRENNLGSGEYLPTMTLGEIGQLGKALTKFYEEHKSISHGELELERILEGINIIHPVNDTGFTALEAYRNRYFIPHNQRDKIRKQLKKQGYKVSFLASNRWRIKITKQD